MNQQLPFLGEDSYSFFGGNAAFEEMSRQALAHAHKLSLSAKLNSQQRFLFYKSRYSARMPSASQCRIATERRWLKRGFPA